MSKSTALLAAALIALPAVGRADRLDARLHEEAPKVVQKLLDKKFTTVGVLRFQVEAPGQKAGYTSPLSGNLVTRVETGLILHAEKDGKLALGVTRDTGATAQKQSVGDWPSKVAERKKLFAADYPLAWGKSSVKPDAFVTGTVRLSKDMKQTTVRLLAFGKATPERLETLAEFTVATDSGVLRDLGLSYALPSAVRARAIKLKKRNDDLDADAVEIVTQQQQKKDAPPKVENPKVEDPKVENPPTEVVTPENPAAPKQKQDTGFSPADVGGVTVRLLADEAEATVREAATQNDGVKWQVESPEPGKRVTIELTNTTEKKLGVVLRLNGVNVVNSQRVEPELCGKVILLPGKKQVVRGFYEVPEAAQPGERGKAKRRDGADEDAPPPQDKPKMTVRPFVVLVGEEASKARAELGDKAGLIDVDVFEPGSAPQQATVNQRGLPPLKALKARETYKGLKTALLQSSGLKTKMEGAGVRARELIVAKPEGEREEVTAGVTSFPNPAFVARVTIKVVPPGS